MNIQHLKTLIAIHERSSFADAAASLYLTPAAISQQMRALEDELQVSLFDRTTRPPRLNAHGVNIVEQARDVLARFNALVDMARSPGEIAGVLSIGSATGITNALVSKALAGLREKYPRLQVRIEEGLTDDLIGRVRRRSLDGALITQPLEPEVDMQILPITSEALLVVAPKSMTERGWKKVLMARPFLRLNRKSGVGALIDVTLRRSGVVVKEAMELDSSESIVGLVSAGLGVGVVPSSRLRGESAARIRTIPFGSPPVRRQVVLIERTNNQRSELAGIFYKELLMLTGEV
ncbi:MAG: LysR substrate-binding domain-containing protein [Rhodospirillales bacterium]|jgi:DNA-binding transcriptional LysR family regulator|nr:LysR substrate-binding domain-containing protein [Rhodospirillales bacterium]